jgi:Domain of unknown function (DUF4432)
VGDRDLFLTGAHLRVRVAPRRGAEIREIASSVSPNMLFFDDWPSPVRASESASYGTSQLDWLSEWRGGWQELFPNAGDACEVMAVPLPFHGEVSQAPWELVSATVGEVVLRAAARLPLTIERRMRLAADRPALLLDEVVTNVGRETVPFLWSHHPAFDARSGLSIDLPAKRLFADARIAEPFADVVPGADGEWPHLPGRDGSPVDVSRVGDDVCTRLLYAPELSSGWVGLRRDDGWGVAMAWDQKTFRDVWIWVETGTASFPWYGRAKVVAIETATASPEMGLAQAHRRLAAHVIEPGSSHRAWLTVSVFQHRAEERVRAVSRDGVVDLAS